VQGHVATITINRLAVRNAMSPEVMVRLDDALFVNMPPS
jgi:enoyl-CoA hydratase/carnithine racemase